MSPPTFESIASAAVASFKELVESDIRCEVLPELLSARELISEFGQQVVLSMLQVYADTRTKQAMAHRGQCRCGQPLEALKKKDWSCSMLEGTIVIVDPYVYCRECKEGARPVQAWIGTDREAWSLSAQEMAVDFAVDESCGKAVKKLAKHHNGVQMGRTTCLRLLHHHGKKARLFIGERLAAGIEDFMKEGLTRSTCKEMEVEYDAGMIPVATLELIPVAEGEQPELTPSRKLPKRRKNAHWEEVKAGLVQIPGTDKRLYCLRPTGELDAVFDDLFAIATLLGWDHKTETRGLADGARYIRTRLDTAFGAGDYRFILDRPHAKEHLSAAGEALEKRNAIPAQTWAKTALEKLESGDADEVIVELRQAYEDWLAEACLLSEHTEQDEQDNVLRQEAGYFHHNRGSVAYAEYREKGWSTASSEIESAHRHIVQIRLKISGAWWHPDHVDDLLALRMLQANGWWDEYWFEQREQWRQRAREFAQARPVVV